MRVGVLAVSTPAPARGIGAERAVAVTRPGAVGPGPAQRARVGEHLQCWSRRFRQGEQQVVLLKTVLHDMRVDLRGDVDAELELPVLLVFRVRLDKEPITGGVEPRHQLDDDAAHGEQSRGEVDVLWPQLGQLAPSQPRLDGRSASSRMGSDGMAA
jgi:hypothetical protein